MYKTLGFRWLYECFCPASAFVPADRYEVRNPQRFIHATVGTHGLFDKHCLLYAGFVSLKKKK